MFFEPFETFTRPEFSMSNCMYITMSYYVIKYEFMGQNSAAIPGSMEPIGTADGGAHASFAIYRAHIDTPTGSAYVRSCARSERLRTVRTRTRGRRVGSSESCTICRYLQGIASRSRLIVSPTDRYSARQAAQHPTGMARRRSSTPYPHYCTPTPRVRR